MIRRAAGTLFRWLASLLGYAIVPEKCLYDFQAGELQKWAEIQAEHPGKITRELRMDHPMLQELVSRYRQCDSRVTIPLLWTEDRLAQEDLVNFRGNNAFMFQLGGRRRNAVGYLLAAYYLKDNDPLGLWSKLEEDGAFGAVTYQIAGKKVSRDLVDSSLEINFLEETLGLSTWENLSVLDIGAGYGRLAHRMAEALPNLSHYLCTDAYPLSTFICDCYLRFREIDSIAESVPLDEIQERLAAQQIDLALNIHSFSECTLAAIDWWLSILEKNQVRYLFIVPNSWDQLLTVEKKHFGGIIEDHGYQRLAYRRKYQDPMVNQYAANAGDYHLFAYKG